jgi:hypothetical protein
LTPRRAAQELPHRVDEPLRRRLAAEQQVPVALEPEKLGAGDCGGEIAPGRDGDAPVA